MVVFLKEIATIPGFFVSSKLIDTRLGRRWTAGLGFITCGICICIYLTNASYIVVAIVSCVSWLAVYIGYSTVFTFTSESFHVGVRTFGFAVCKGWEKVATLVFSPFIGYVLAQGHYGLVVASMSLGTVLIGVFALWLPETRGRDTDKGLGAVISKNIDKTKI